MFSVHPIPRPDFKAVPGGLYFPLIFPVLGDGGAGGASRPFVQIGAAEGS